MPYAYSSKSSKYAKKPYRKSSKKSYKSKSKPRKSSFTKQIAPVASGSKYNYTPPSMKTTANECVISHIERVGTITQHDSFSLSQIKNFTGLTQSKIEINPGIPSSFPWLSSIANNYESYVFEDLQYEYRTKVNTGVNGDVSLAIDYDNNDADPSSTIQMENWSDSCNSAPWQDVVLAAKKQNLRKRKTYYVRGGPIATVNNDRDLYDTGSLFVAVEGQATASNDTTMGYLYCRYKIRLMTPALNNTFAATAGGCIVGAATFSAAMPLGTGAVPDPQSMGLSYNQANGEITIYDAGTYIVSCFANGPVSAPVMTNVTGCTFTTISISTQGTTSITQYYVLEASGYNSRFKFSCTGIPTASNLMVVRAPASSLN